MSSEPIGVLHPGEMGAGIAAELVRAGHEVLFASEGRSAASLARAEAGGLIDAHSLDVLAARCGVVFSICPPDAAVTVARQISGYGGVFVDANAVSPRTARTVAAIVQGGGASYVDGGIIGSPPDARTTTRLYLSGEGAKDIAMLFDGTQVSARVVSLDPSAASAVKVGYAAWTKGTAAMLLAVRAFARAAGVEDALVAQWAESNPEVLDRSIRAAASARTKAWRWAGEMDEIAVALGDENLPSGFHEGAAEIYRRSSPDGASSDLASLDEVLESVSDPATSDLHRRSLGSAREVLMEPDDRP